jgi:uncharacterized OsmC-like protein
MSNLRAREPLERAQRLFRERPSAAKKNVPATAVLRNGLRCEITGPGGESVATDMPGPLGGEGSAPSPGWLFRASLASCSASAIAMRAAMRGIELREIEVTVQGDFDARGAVGIDGVSMALSQMRMSVKISAADASEVQLREIAQWGATQSTVSATLRERSPVTLEVLVV